MGRRERKGLGHLGLGEMLEPRVREVVAERLGVPAEWLRPEVSFEQDLASCPVELAELIVDLEARLGVVIPGAALGRIHTYGELVEAVITAKLADEPEALPSVLLRVTITPPRGRGRATLTRTTWLTPYALETIAADARRAGSGARLDVIVPASAPWVVVPRVETCLAAIAGHGVAVAVRHAEPPRNRAVA